MANLLLNKILMYDSPSEINFIQEDLRYNRVDLTWNSRWVNDSSTFGFGFGHVEDGFIKDPTYGYKARGGCRMELRDGWHDFVSIFENGTSLASIRTFDNPPLSKIKNILATDFSDNKFQLHHLDANASYTGKPVGNHLLGDGKDGNIRITKADTIINEYKHITENISGGDQIIKVENTTGLSVGDEILILQTQYDSSDPTYYGNFEFHYIGAIIDSTTIQTQWRIGTAFYSDLPNRSVTCQPHPCIGLGAQYPPLPNCNCGAVTNARTAQIITVPHYSSMRIYENASLTAKAWDGSTGGVLIFRCTGLVDSSGDINVMGKGFRGSIRPPTLIFDGWDYHYTSSGGYYTPSFRNVIDNDTVWGWGSTGEGCHGYCGFNYGNGRAGIGGAGGCGNGGNKDNNYEFPPGAGGSFGTLGGEGFKEFWHWYCAEWKATSAFTIACVRYSHYSTWLRSRPSYTICDDQLMQMTLGTGGGGTMNYFGGNGSGAILIFCEEMLVRQNCGIYATGQLAKIGSTARYSSGGGHGSGGPIVISVTKKFTNRGTVDCGGAHYLDGQSGYGGYGGDGRIVWDVAEFEGNQPINWGSFRVPATIREAVRWGKLPLNSMDTLLIPYYAKTTKNNEIDVSDIKRLDSIVVTHQYPAFTSKSDIRVVLGFKENIWVYWSNNRWNKLDDLGDIGTKGMNLTTLHSLTSDEYMLLNGFTSECKKLNIAVSIMTGIRLDSPAIFKITISGKIRSWRLWKITHPRQIGEVKIGHVNAFIHQY